MGLLLTAIIHPANVQDRDGVVPLLRAARRLFPFVTVIFADGAYRFCQRSCHQVLPCRGESGGRSSGLQDAQHGHGSPEKEQPAAIGGNMSVMAGAEAEKVAELIVAAAEPGGRSRALEAPHGPVSAFDARWSC